MTTSSKRLQWLCAGLLTASFASANPVKLFQQGNKAYAAGDYDSAIHAYQEAAEKYPGSAEIYYNLGNAQYRSGEFEEAGGSFEVAASLAHTDALRSQSWYNLANCIAKIGEGLREADPYTATTHYARSAGLYRLALDYNPGFGDAEYNLEICQRISAMIENEIREQAEKETRANDLVHYIREKLEELIERQTQLMGTQKTGAPQLILEQDTRELAKRMEDSGLHIDLPLPDGTTMSGPLKDTYGHTAAAASAMAVPNQSTARAELISALGALPEDPNQQDGESEESEEYDMDSAESDEDAGIYEEASPFGDFSEYEEIRGVPPPNKTEMDILAEEIRNQDARKKKRAGEYKSVEKDW